MIDKYDLEQDERNRNVNIQIIKELKSMSIEEFKHSLIKAGIITRDGKLTENYDE